MVGHYQRIAGALLFVQAMGMGALASFAGLGTGEAGLLASQCAVAVGVALCIHEAGVVATRARADAAPALRLQQRLWAVIALVSWPMAGLLWVYRTFGWLPPPWLWVP